MYIILGYFGNATDAWAYGQPNTGMPFASLERARSEVLKLKADTPHMNFEVTPLLRRDPMYKPAPVTKVDEEAA